MRGFEVGRQVKVPVLYKGAGIKSPLFLDLLVDNKVIVEVKAIEKHNPVYQAQLLTYLRLAKKKLGLVISFGEFRVSDGIYRVVNGL